MNRLIHRFVEDDLRMEPYVVKQVVLLQHESESRLDYVFGVAQSVHPTNLIAVVRWDVDLDEFRASFDELEEDLGVEMEIVGVQCEANARECPGGVSPVTCVPFA